MANASDYDYSVETDEIPEVQTDDSNSSVSQAEGNTAVDTEQINTEDHPNANLFDYSEDTDDDLTLDTEEDGETTSNTGDDSSAGSEDSDADDNPGNADTGSPIDQLSNDMIFRAASAGLTADDVKSFTSPAALEAAVVLMERNALTGGTAANSQSGQAEEAEKAEEFKPFELELPEDMDDESAKLLKQMNEHMNTIGKAKHEETAALKKELAELRSGTESYQEQMQQTKQQETQKWLNETVEKANLEYDGLFKDQKNLQALVVEMDAQDRAHPDWSNQKIFDAAMSITFPDKRANRAVTQAKTKATNHRQNRAIAKPSNQKPRNIDDMPKGKKRAKARVAEAWSAVFGGK